MIGSGQSRGVEFPLMMGGLYNLRDMSTGAAAYTPASVAQIELGVLSMPPFVTVIPSYGDASGSIGRGGVVVTAKNPGLFQRLKSFFAG